MKLTKLWGGFGKKDKIIKELEDKLIELAIDKTKMEKSYSDKNWKLLCDLSDANDKKIEALNEIEKLNKEIEQIKEKAKIEKKELKDKIKELEKELEKRYIVKKIRSTKPVKQTTKIKSSVVQSNAIKLVKEQL